MSHKKPEKTKRTTPVNAFSTELAGVTPSVRICKGTCGLPIAEKRLAAQPNATLCVPCLEAAGDVPVLKRFDETTADGEQLQTFFTKDRRLETEMLHRNKVIASQENFDIAVGDDSHLGKELSEIIDGGRSLSTIFDDPDDGPSTKALPGRELFHAQKVAQKLAPVRNTEMALPRSFWPKDFSNAA